MKYREDIDGLRCLAVLLVVVFHANRFWCPGGFIGVDVFFVISGYLITTIICKQIDEKRFSLTEFYERRIKRIFPAFVGCVFVTLALSWIVVLPSSMKGVGRSCTAASLSSANILFWLEDDYFAAASEEKPLLHTWSLGVEEQFYLFLPLALLVLALTNQQKKRRKQIIAITLAASFVASLVFLEFDHASVFFLLPFRAWELLVGSALAVDIATSPTNERVKSLLGVIGFVGILFTSFYISKETSFPGFWALSPCICAAFVILSQGRGIAGRLLSASPCVFVGKISYSVYLFHWPAYFFSRQLDPLNNHPGIVSLVTIFGGILLGAISWQLIEQPFRSAKSLGRRGTFAGFAVVSILLGLIGAHVHLSEGAPYRFSDTVNSLDSNAFLTKEPEADFELRASGRSTDVSVYGKSKPSFAVIGDSHSLAIAKVLAFEAGKNEISMLHCYASATAPIANAEFINNKLGREHVEKVLTLIEEEEAIKTVVLICRWSVYVKGPT